MPQSRHNAIRVNPFTSLSISHTHSFALFQHVVLFALDALVIFAIFCQSRIVVWLYKPTIGWIMKLAQSTTHVQCIERVHHASFSSNEVTNKPFFVCCDAIGAHCVGICNRTPSNWFRCGANNRQQDKCVRECMHAHMSHPFSWSLTYRQEKRKKWEKKQQQQYRSI